MILPEGLLTENVIDIDHNVFAIAPCITEDGILEQFQTDQVDSDEDDNDCDEESAKDVAPEWSSRLTFFFLIFLFILDKYYNKFTIC